MRVALISTHRSDRAHYAPLRRLLEADKRFEVLDFLPFAHEADVGVVLGDRYEMLEAAMQIVYEHIPLLHIHGGEHTFGSLDERYRWAMTMLADKHCVATEEAKWEVDKHVLGGAKRGFTDAYRTIGLDSFVTGAPGLDDIHDRQPFPNAPKIVVLYNPAIDEDTTRRESRAIWDATLPTHDITFIKPNGDRFSDAIPWSANGHEYDHEKFRDLLAAAHVIVGNSSAGIIEAPSLGTWTVNVGERQAGRPRAASVYDETASASDIRAEIMALLDRPRADVANPYGDGHASERIRNVLLEMDMGGKQ